MNARKIAFVVLGHLFLITGYTQPLLSNYYSKLRIDKTDTYVAMVDSIYIDTLIMNDNSVLSFKHSTILIIENAFIGKNCEFNSRGVDGEKGKTGTSAINGEPGTDGRSLALIIVFKELGQLKIDTGGGNGGNGANGQRGSGQHGPLLNVGGSGQNGGHGGNSGNAGDIKFFYTSEGFPLTFNSKGMHSIQLNYFGGKSGSAGKGGKGGSGGSGGGGNPTDLVVPGKTGLNGVSGLLGRKGQDGELTLKKITED